MSSPKQAWYVSGDPEWTETGLPTLFESKAAAEFYARIIFPDEDPYQRYARIHYRELYSFEG